MGRSGTTNGAGWDVGWVSSEWRALTSGAGAPLFGEIDTYGWDGASLIRKERYVWLGRPVESKPPPEVCTLRIGIAWLIDRNTEIALSVRRNCSIRAPKSLYPYAGIALFVRRNCCIRASILLYRRSERRLAGRSFGEEGYVDPACIRIARGE